MNHVRDVSGIAPEGGDKRNKCAICGKLFADPNEECPERSE